MSLSTLQWGRKMRRRCRLAGVMLSGVALVLLAGCGREAAGGGVKAGEKGRYPLTGEVLRVEAERKDGKRIPQTLVELSSYELKAAAP